MNLPSSPKKTILLVDDHQEILDFISDDLMDSYRVETASDGLLALAILERKHVDLVVSDLMMPNLDGFQLCHRIKKNQIFKHIPFIMLTAKNSLQAKIEGLEHGADAYIEKPFSPSFLQAQIGSLLKNRQYVEEHYVQNVTHPVAMRGMEDDIMNRLQQLIESHLDNPNLSVEFIADELHLSRATLYRKIKQGSDLSPHELINRARLNRAGELLNSTDLRVYEVSAMVGFNSCSHFIRNFQRYFGVSPKEWGARKIQPKDVSSLFNRGAVFFRHDFTS